MDRPVVDGVDIYHVALPMHRPLRAAGGTIRDRHLALVAVHAGGATGWGEAAPYPGHTEEGIDDAWRALVTDPPVRLGQPMPDRAEPPAHLCGTAAAAVNQASWDLAARLSRAPLWRYIGGTSRRVPAGAVVGLPDAAFDAEVAALVERGYRHIKIKVAPWTDPTVIARAMAAHPSVGFAADANGSYPSIADATLKELDALGLDYIEQPLAPSSAGDSGGTLATATCLDEAVAALPDALAAAASAVADILNVKPGRIGPAGCVAVHAAAAGRIALRVGGLVESGIGKAHAVAVATLPGCTVAGDLAASDRYFDDDLVRPSFDLDGRGMLTVPTGPGLGVAVSLDAVRDHALDTVSFS